MRTDSGKDWGTWLQTNEHQGFLANAGSQKSWGRTVPRSPWRVIALPTPRAQTCSLQNGENASLYPQPVVICRRGRGELSQRQAGRQPQECAEYGAVRTRLGTSWRRRADAGAGANGSGGWRGTRERRTFQKEVEPQDKRSEAHQERPEKTVTWGRGYLPTRV